MMRRRGRVELHRAHLLAGSRPHRLHLREAVHLHVGVQPLEDARVRLQGEHAPLLPRALRHDQRVAADVGANVDRRAARLARLAHKVDDLGLVAPVEEDLPLDERRRVEPDAQVVAVRPDHLEVVAGSALGAVHRRQQAVRPSRPEPPGDARHLLQRDDLRIAIGHRRAFVFHAAHRPTGPCGPGIRELPDVGRRESCLTRFENDAYTAPTIEEQRRSGLVRPRASQEESRER